MLYLRTGANGSCKTLFTLKDVRDLQLKEGRPVAHNGRFKLKPDKQAEFGWKTIEFKDWEQEPDGTIFLIDECHNDLPKRPNGSAVPRHVSQLAEHRARGFDFFLLTQHPSNVDSFVTKIIGPPGWHQHLKRAFGASDLTSVLQFSAVNNQCEKDGAGKNAQVTMRSQPKEVYGWYDSAMLHTGKRKIPKQVFFLAVALVLVPAMFYGAGKLMWNRTQAKAAPESAPVVPGSFVPGGQPGQDRAKPLTATEYVAAYRPRIASLMHSAPVYDKLTEPKRVPVPAACIEMPSKGCKCFTQDATPYVTDDATCRQVVRGGIFLAFEERSKVERSEPEKRPVAPESPAVTIIQDAPAPVAAAPAAALAQEPLRIASVRR